MNKYFILFFLSPTIVLANEVSFQKAHTSYTQKDHGTATYHGALMIQKNFEDLISASTKELPFINKIIASNFSFSLDMRNDQIDYKTKLEYSFTYNQNTDVILSLVYAFEESSYYKTYIDNIDFITFPVEFQIYSLKNPTLGKYLWYPQENTLYYVYSFSEQIDSKEVSIIPGLLLKIQFSSKKTHNTELINTINTIISAINWNNLVNIYSIK